MAGYYGSIQNRIDEDAVIGQPEPYVGMGATLLLYSDRHPATIIAIVDDVITVQEDYAIRADRNGMSESQSYVYVENPKAPLRYFRTAMRGQRAGRWQEVYRGISGRFRQVGSMGCGLRIGEREEYRDPSF